jgi:hypothetical protein
LINELSAVNNKGRLAWDPDGVLRIHLGRERQLASGDIALTDAGESLPDEKDSQG